MFADSRLSPLPHVPARAPAMPPALRVGLIGMGTVGTGVWRVLRRNQALIAARAGRAVEIVAVATRTPAGRAVLPGWPNSSSARSVSRILHPPSG